MRKTRPYGTGAYGVGLYERYAGPWMAPASCRTGSWVPFVPGALSGVAGAPRAVMPDARATREAAST